MQARVWPPHVKVESSGYITVVDMDKDAEAPKAKPIFAKKIEEVKEASDPKEVEFKEFFEELLPFKGKAKHIYSV
jgi:hypothetical protein